MEIDLGCHEDLRRRCRPRRASSSYSADPCIQGFTTNPTLMRAAGITDYETFARDVVELVRFRPISFEVFSDEPDIMHKQALKISSWGEHVHVKIPITDTDGASTAELQLDLVDATACSSTSRRC